MDKGQFNGTCNLSRCTTGKPATWYNHGSLNYYCEECAKMLSADPVNAADAQRLFGHALCTEGQYIPEDVKGGEVFSKDPFASEPYQITQMGSASYDIGILKPSNPWPSPHHSKKRK